MKKHIVALMISWVFILVPILSANAALIDLRDFSLLGNVTIAPDGSSATMREDPENLSVVLSNDPGLGDLGIFIPLDSMSLTFDFNFVEPEGNDDEFFARLFEPISFGTLADADGNNLEFFTDIPSSGTVSWNLLGADFLGSTVGMEFLLNPKFFGQDPDPSSILAENSSVFINNVSVNPVPEPATLLLVGSGLAGFFAVRRKKGKRAGLSE
jgi:hypothetical protein